MRFAGLVRRPRFWLLVVLSTVLAIGSTRVTIDALFGNRNPALAARLVDSPRAHVRLWMLQSLADLKQRPDPAIVALARDAIVTNPMEVQAIRSLAYYHSLSGRAGQARHLAELAEDVTRRDQLTQLLLASDLASRGDTGAAMRHLALALTVTNQGREQIFAAMLPVLAQAGASRSFAGLVEPGRPWLGEFFDFAIRRDPENAAPVADILASATPSGARWALRETGPILLSALAESGDAERLRRLLALAPPSLAKQVGDPALTAEHSTQANGWLDWTPVEDGGNGAQLGPTENGGYGIIAYAASGVQRKPVLRRTLMLPAGRYSLSDRRADASGDPEARFSWTVACHGAGGWRDIAQRRAAGAHERVTFTVDAECPLQLVQLEATTTRGDDGAQLLIDGFRLSPLRSP